MYTWHRSYQVRYSQLDSGNDHLKAYLDISAPLLSANEGLLLMRQLSSRLGYCLHCHSTVNQCVDLTRRGRLSLVIRCGVIVGCVAGG